MKDPQTAGESELFYELEASAAMRKQCELVFMKDQGRSIIRGRIDAVFIKEDIEMVQMDSGLEIPVRDIMQIDSRVINAVG